MNNTILNVLTLVYKHTIKVRDSRSAKYFPELTGRLPSALVSLDANSEKRRVTLNLLPKRSSLELIDIPLGPYKPAMEELRFFRRCPNSKIAW